MAVDNAVGRYFSAISLLLILRIEALGTSTINSYGDLNSCGDCSGGPEDNGTDVLDYMGEAIPKASR